MHRFRPKVTPARVAASFGCALLSLVVMAATAQASYPGERNGRIAFVQDGYIWTVKPDGTRFKRLVRGRDPSYSPSGKRIAFSRKGDIWVMRSNGTERKRVTNNETVENDPTWSPKGKRLAFSDEDGNIFVLRSKAPYGSPVLLVEGGPCGENCVLEEHFAPSWGVDGYIYFTTHTEWDDPECTERFDLWRVDPSTEATDYGFEDAVDGDPDPEAVSIVFSDLRLSLACEYLDTANLVIVDIDGAEPRSLTEVGEDRADYDAVFSPTGNRVAFTRILFNEERSDIYTIKRDGTKLRRIVRDADSPTWQPRKN
jgi:Tol biopolymer transport system component